MSGRSMVRKTLDEVYFECDEDHELPRVMDELNKVINQVPREFRHLAKVRFWGNDYSVCLALHWGQPETDEEMAEREREEAAGTEAARLSGIETLRFLATRHANDPEWIAFLST